MVDIGAKSRDHDLGNKHTWAHSHYLMQQRDRLGGWEKVRLEYKVCRCRSRSKISGLLKEGLAPPPSSSPMALPLSRHLCFHNPSKSPSFLSLYPALLRPPLPQNCFGISQDCRLPQTLFCFQNYAGCVSIRCWAAILLSNTSLA